MSEEEKPLEFSARDLMPDWAQAKPSEPQKDYAKRYAADEDRGDRRGGGGRRDDRRGGFAGGGRRDDRRGGSAGGGGGQRDDRRGGFAGGGGQRGPRPDRGGDRPRGDRHEGDRRGGGDRYDRPREEPPAAGVLASLEPSGPAVEGLTRHIRETFRSFPVSDLAKMVLEARERYRIRFTATEPVRLSQCLADGSLWLSREEAISHLLSGPALEHYYTAENIQVDPPAGNFAVIAVCGMSGVILGPPNHHEYQRNIARLHRERFSDMPLERFKSRIRMESGEEILEKWREQVSCVRQYRVKPTEQSSPVEEPPAEEAPVVTVTEPITEEAIADGSAAGEAGNEEVIVAEISEESPEVDTPLEETETGEPEEAEAPVLEAKTDEGPVFNSFEEVGRHFREHFAPLAIVETAVAVVPGNIAGRLLSPGLLAHLRLETEKLRRGFPLAMIQSLCGEFERKGLKFFKRGKKSLHVSAVRPKALNEATNLTGAIQAIVDFVKTAPKPSVSSLLEALVPGFKKPEGLAVDESPEWSDAARTVLKDLRWLTAEGYLLEFADTGLAIGRQPQENAPTQPKANQAKPAKEKATAPANQVTTADTVSVEEVESPAEEVESPVEEVESPVEEVESPVEEVESPVEEVESPVEEVESPVDFKTAQEDLGDLSAHPVPEDGSGSEDPHFLPESGDPVATL